MYGLELFGCFENRTFQFPAGQIHEEYGGGGGGLCICASRYSTTLCAVHLSVGLGMCPTLLAMLTFLIRHKQLA